MDCLHGDWGRVRKVPVKRKSVKNHVELNNLSAEQRNTKLKEMAANPEPETTC